MSLAVWVKRDGVARVTAYRWLRAGLLLVSARKVGRLILIEDPSVAAGPRSRTAVYVRVAAWATDQQMPVDNVVTEVGVCGQRAPLQVPRAGSRACGGTRLRSMTTWCGI
jgi:predicted site-specific integrase-resolvase